MSKVLLLRTCNADMTSCGGFVWPESGPVKAPDWDGGEPVCGGKLHGFLWGEGDGKLASREPDAKWLVVAAEADEVVEIGQDGGKHGFRRGEVVFCGSREDATQYLVDHGAAGRVIVGGTVTAGDRGTATAGDRGTATAGDGGTATAGDYGTATAGDYGTATAGDGGTVAVRWHDDKRFRLAIGYVGEDGIEPNTPYVVHGGRLVRKSAEAA